ncbi:MAG: NAD(+) synthase [Propionibacteriaceae bacterium]|nr:NAD(+) synthase [Propionibacteriaceae bacterium]
MSFANIYDQGFFRVAACSLPVRIADPAANAAATVNQARECAAQGVGLAVFPELGLSGYSLEDLFLADVLLKQSETALALLATQTSDLELILVVGAPLRYRHRLYNCAIAVHRGQILGVVPKSYLPTYREFYEKRQFAAGQGISGTIDVAGASNIPFGADLIFTTPALPDFVLGVEICEDLWVPLSPGAEAALAGATVIANPSSSPITVAKARERQSLCANQSGKLLAGYAYAAAGAGESSTDLSWDGQTLIYECGELLAKSGRFIDSPITAIADIDLSVIKANRIRQGTFDDNRLAFADRLAGYRKVVCSFTPPTGDLGLNRKVARFPFVPDERERLDQDCYEAYNIQVSALTQRMKSIGSPKLVIGVSGGLDSSHAIIVAAKAMDNLERPRSDILAYTMPGFATSEQTKANATALAKTLGVSFAQLDIRPAAIQMLTDMGHPFAAGEQEYDVAFENVQAGLRTDYLFRLANHHGGIVVGTGDLSELALGWCTYGVGDQMSHYNVNAGVPKTLIQHLIRWVIATGQFDNQVAATLRAILATEISPELIPVAAGEKPQSTQEVIGPYPLQDFNLFYTLRYGLTPTQIAFRSWHAWKDAEAGTWPDGFPEHERDSYDLAAIKKWLRVFCQRFFGFSQFKRSAMPNGPKVVRGGSLSPRGDWRMPSDSSASLWVADVESIPDQL